MDRKRHEVSGGTETSSHLVPGLCGQPAGANRLDIPRGDINDATV
jgi:hypothetical protein